MIGIDSKVRITGPARNSTSYGIGKTFQITELWKIDGEIFFSGHECGNWYPASSLELDELKIGDEVTVRGPPCGYETYMGGRSGRGAIEEINLYGNCKIGSLWYPASSLRKIGTQLESTPELEKAVGKAVNEFLIGEIKKIGDRLGQHDEEIKGIYDILPIHEDIHEKIDESLSEQKAANDRLRKRCHHMHKYIGKMDKQLFLHAAHIMELEAWQKEQMEKDQPQGQTIKQRSVKMAAFYDEIAPFTPSFLESLQKIEAWRIKKQTPEEPIKVGDWAQVIGRCVLGRKDEIGKVFRITEFGYPPDGGKAYSANNCHAYFPESLHVLSDAEIASKLNGGQP